MIYVHVYPVLDHRHVILLQFDLTGSSCPTFSYSEYLQIYDHINHPQIQSSKYCILKSLNENIRTLISNKGHGLSIDIFPPCHIGRCSN